VLSYARELLVRLPTMTDQTLGRNVKDRVFAWAFGGGWGWAEGWPGPGRPFDYFLSREDYGLVSEESIAESVREALGLEAGGTT
jgi:hypothetical protein